MKRLAVMFAFAMGSCFAADVASVEGEWRLAFNEKDYWDLHIKMHPKTANSLTDVEKKQMIALGELFNKSSFWIFKKNGTVETVCIISQQLRDAVKAAQSKMDPSPAEVMKAYLERWEKLKPNDREVSLVAVWTQTGNKLQLKEEAQEEMGPPTLVGGEISDEGIKFEDGRKLVRIK